MQVLGRVRNLFGYPWRKDWPNPPRGAELYSGEGAGGLAYLTLGLAASRFLDFSFQALLQDRLETNRLLGAATGALTLLTMTLLPIFLIFRDEKWFLWIWRDGAVLQRGFKRIEISKAEVSQIKEINRGRLCLELFHGKKRYRLPLEKTANLLGLRHLVSPHLRAVDPEKSDIFKSSFNIFEEGTVVAFLLAMISLASIHKQFLKSGETDILALIVLACSTAFIIWKVYSQRPIMVRLSAEGITRAGLTPCRLRWEDVTRVVIDQNSRDISDSLTIETNECKITVPASTSNYWHLERQVLERIPRSAKVSRE